MQVAFAIDNIYAGICGARSGPATAWGAWGGETRRGSPLGRKCGGCPGIFPAGVGFAGFLGFAEFPGFAGFGWGVVTVSFASGWVSMRGFVW